MISSLDQKSNEEAEASWLQKEEDDKLATTQNQMHQQLDAELNPKRTAFHIFFIIINGITIFAAFNMGVGQFIGIAYGKAQSRKVTTPRRLQCSNLRLQRLLDQSSIF